MVADAISAKILCQLVAGVGSVPREVITARGCDVEEFASRVPVDGRQPPARCDVPQHTLLKIRHLEDGCEVEQLTSVAQAIATARITVAKIRIRDGRIRPRIA